MSRYLSSAAGWTGLVLWCLLGACRTAAPGDAQTNLFSGYLAAHFGQRIPQEPHCYLLVPATGCQGGMAATLTAIDAQRYPPARVTVISANKALTAACLHQDWPVWQDATGDLDIQNLPIANVTLIVTGDGRILKILNTSECAESPAALIGALQQG